MTLSSAVLLHSAFLLPGVVLLWSFEIRTASVETTSSLLDVVVFLSLAYLSGLAAYGIAYHLHTRNPFRRWLIDEDEESKLRGILVERFKRRWRPWNKDFDWTEEGDLKQGTTWVFSYVRLYVANFGSDRLWGRLMYNWDLIRVCLTASAGSIIAGFAQLLRLDKGGGWLSGLGLIYLGLLLFPQLKRRYTTFVSEVCFAILACDASSADETVSPGVAPDRTGN